MSIRTRRKPMRAVAVAVAAAVGASLLAISGPTPVGATPTVTEATRIAGADRYITANLVAEAKVGTARNANRVVLVSGENFPDGLAAASLAGALGAPMLLTQSAALPTSVLATLTTITSAVAAGTAKNVIIVGGTSAVSADIAQQLTASGYTVTRIAGDDRYATANAVAAATRTNSAGGAIGTFGASNLRTAFLASGTNFPDALAASAQAYSGRHPIFLTNGTTLTDETKAAMTAAQVQQVIILGGTSAVSAEVATAVAGVTGVIASSRISGDTRYDTATALATALSAGGQTQYTSKAFLVSGTNFPDALVASQLAGAATGGGAIIPVTSPLPTAVSTWVTANQATLATIQAIGGTTAVPADIVTEVKTGATTAPLTATITAVDGATTFTVVFSAAVTAGTAGVGTSYRVTSATGTIKSLVAQGGYVAATRTATITLDSSGRLAPGDTVQILPASIVSGVTAGLFVTATSTTVVADTTAPSATIVAYPTTAGAVSTDPSASGRIWVTFSQNANLSNTAAVETMLNGSLAYLAPQIGSTPANPANCAYVPNTTTFRCNVTGALTAAGTISLAAMKFESSAIGRVSNSATTATITADATAPALSSVTFTQSGTATGAQQALRGLANGTVTISARAGTAVDGKAGNAVKVATVATPNVNPVCVYSSTLNTVTVSSAATASALAVANACNSVPAFTALFVATPNSANPAVAAFADGAATVMAGGRDLVTLNLTLSEGIDPTAALSALTFANVVSATGQPTGLTYVETVTKKELQHLAGALTITVLTDGTFTANLSTVALTAAVRDRAGNPAGTTAVVVTAAS